MLLTVLLMLGSATAPAQVVDGERIVKASMLAERRDYSKPFYVGIQFDLSSGWYLYWINPGDSGLPIEVTWELPEGYEAGPILYPVPQKYGSSESIAYGFKRQLLLLCEIRPTGRSRIVGTPSIKVSLDWLVCKESCLRGSTEVILDLNRLSPSQEMTEDLLRRAKARLPRSSSSLHGTVDIPEIVRDGQMERVTLRFSGNERIRIKDFYPEPIDDYTIEHSSISVSNNQVTIPLMAQTQHSTLKRIRGLLITEGDAYQLDIPVVE